MTPDQHESLVQQFMQQGHTRLAAQQYADAESRQEQELGFEGRVIALLENGIEKAARAICKAHYKDPDAEENNVADGLFYPNWTEYETDARAALQAIINQIRGGV